MAPLSMRSSIVPRSDSTKHNLSNPFNVFQERVVVAMVGLPARGKSYISKALVRYMNFLGCPTKLFNAGNMRRNVGLAGADASFFDNNNAKAKDLREQVAVECLEELLMWIQRPGGGCSLGIFDATNTTVARRKKIMDRCREETKKDPCLQVIFVESLADNEELLEQNYRMKLSNDDYKGMNPEKALADFRARVKQYEAVYEPVCDEEADCLRDLRYVKMINAGEKLVTRGISGHVPRKIQRLLGSIHLWPRTIWIALNGETEYDQDNILGGDPPLTEEGWRYAEGIAALVKERAKTNPCSHAEPGHGDLVLYTGTHQRYIETVRIVQSDLQQQDDGIGKVLVLTEAHTNDLCEGLLDSTTETEREERFPEEAAARRVDKLNYRYPGVGGESYYDLIARVNELVCLLEQSRGNSLVVCNRAVFRVVMGYFLGNSIEEIPHLEIPSGVLELRKDDSGFSRTVLNIEVGKVTSAVGVGTAYK